MVVELLIPLLDKCIQLLQMKEVHKQQFLDEMVTPAYKQFELLHKGYLESFASYRTQIAEAGDFAEVAREITQSLRNDNLFTSDQRAKAAEFTEAVHLKKAGDSKLAEGIRGFADSISQYLGAKVSLVSHDETAAPLFPYNPASQRWRSSFAEEIRKLKQVDNVPDETKKKAALSHLETTVGEMQELYHHVTTYYMLIKKELLNAIRQ